MTGRSASKMAGPGEGAGGGGTVAYVLFSGKILSMPGWMQSNVRSIVVTKEDGNVEIMSRDCSTAGSRGNLLADVCAAEVPREASPRPSAPVMCPRPKFGPVTYGPVAAAENASGAACLEFRPDTQGSLPPPPPPPEAEGGGKSRRRKKSRAVHVCPRGLPPRVYMSITGWACMVVARKRL